MQTSFTCSINREHIIGFWYIPHTPVDSTPLVFFTKCEMPVGGLLLIFLRQKTTSSITQDECLASLRLLHAKVMKLNVIEVGVVILISQMFQGGPSAA